MTAADIRALLDAAAKATPGPWEWRQNRMTTHIDLAAPHGGGTVVMDFARKGMQGAEPRFGVSIDDEPRGRRGGILVGASELIDRDPDKLLRHPDAEWIAAASPDVVASLARIALAAVDYQKRWPAPGQPSLAQALRDAGLL